MTLEDLAEATSDLLNEIRGAQIRWAQKRQAEGKISPENLIEACAVYAVATALTSAFPLPDCLSDESAEAVKQFAAGINLQTGTVADVPEPAKAQA